MPDSTQSKRSILEQKWEREADVVVAGYGGAGAAAAIAAHDAGAEVLIVESMAEEGGNTLLSMGGFLCPSSVEEAVLYISALCDLSHADKDEKVIRAFAEEAARNVDWLKSLREGTEVHIYGHAGFPQLPGSHSIDKYLIKGRQKGATAFAANLWEVLSYAVEEKRGIPVLKNTPAKRLVAHDGEVFGIIVESQGRECAVRAKRAVILTTGGYEYDHDMLRNFVKGFPIHAAGNPGNRGDGVRMAQKAGAALWHMNSVSCGLGIKVPGHEAAFLAMITAPGHILVDQAGRRFMDEHAIESHAWLLAVDYYDSASLTYPRIPCYAIFDEAGRLRGPISRMAGFGAAGRQHRWSHDNSIEIEKGWIIKGETLEELSRKLNLAPGTLVETVERWNADVKSGRDTLFDRPIHSQGNQRPAYKSFESYEISSPIDQPPFYGIILHPCLANTQGGPRRNEAARVMDPFGKPIRRLYSAGELGSMWSMIYQGAGNIAECFAFGRIAGRNAANERPWQL